jgi:hypothetical protein
LFSAREFCVWCLIFGFDLYSTAFPSGRASVIRVRAGDIAVSDLHRQVNGCFSRLILRTGSAP